MFLPGSVEDIADRLREPDRQTRFGVIHETFGERGVVATRTDDPERADLEGIGTINLDTLHVNTSLLPRASGLPHVIPFRGPVEIDRLEGVLHKFADRVVRFAERHRSKH